MVDRVAQMYNRISVSIENWCENKSYVDGFLEISSSYKLTSVWWFQKDADIRAVREEGRWRKKSHLLCSSVCDVNERVMRLWTESVIGSTYRVYYTLYMKHHHQFENCKSFDRRTIGDPMNFVRAQKCCVCGHHGPADKS